jgi:hypothetical protein
MCGGKRIPLAVLFSPIRPSGVLLFPRITTGLISSLLVKELQTNSSILHHVLFFLFVFLPNGIHPHRFHLSVAFNAEMETVNNVIREICSVRCGEEGIVHLEERSFIYCLNRVLPQLKKKYPITYMNCRDSLMFFPGILQDI